jgi:hypothetical protein
MIPPQTRKRKTTDLGLVPQIFLLERNQPLRAIRDLPLRNVHRQTELHKVAERTVDRVRNAPLHKRLLPPALQQTALHHLVQHAPIDERGRDVARRAHEARQERLAPALRRGRERGGGSEQVGVQDEEVRGGGDVDGAWALGGGGCEGADDVEDVACGSGKCMRTCGRKDDIPGRISV